MKKLSKVFIIALAAITMLASCQRESSEKKILEFKFASPAVEAVITESAKTIVAVVPEGTDITGLVPIITISDKATVTPASGSKVDFTNPVDFTVTAEDGSSVVYKSTVTIDANGGGTDPTTWSGNISANTTWPDRGLDVDYIIDGWTYIEGNACLTIEPGVTIMFTGTDGGLDVGENAGLKMVGTAEKPIRLVNPLNNNNPGAWHGIIIHSKRNDNQFEYVEFINGGSNENTVISNEGKLSMKHCLINGGLGNGVELYFEGMFTAFENNTIKNVNYPLWINAYEKAGILGGGNTYTNNTNNMITVDAYWLDKQQTATINNQGIPYYAIDGVNVCENAKMIVNAGAEFVFAPDKELIVSDDSRLEVNGTESQPVIFRAKNAEDPWRGILFWSNRTGNLINNAKIMNCGIGDYGSERTCLWIGSDAKLTLTNNVFGPSNYNGVGIDYIGNWSNVTHSGNSFTGCAEGNVYIFSGGEWNGTEYEDNSTLNELP
ncbi:MAG: DUF5018 domain-containing protein [Bacteroidales bacterium]|nr:DUF5018 domain-containing protein [Bacteroidales bacterium]